MSAGQRIEQPIPILLYHSVSDEPPGWIRPLTVSPATFGAHLRAIIEAGLTPLTISELVLSLAGKAALPTRPVAVTFDDGFADFAETAAPMMNGLGIVSTLYVTTGMLSRHPGDAPETCLPPASMLTWSQLPELARSGVELGAHTHTHPQLDTISSARAAQELVRSKSLLEDALGHAVPSFAYPHGHYSSRVRDLVRQAGYESACAVGNALSLPHDDHLALCRLTVCSDTPVSALASWLAGEGAPVGPYRERPRTKIWRCYRRGRVEARRAWTALASDRIQDSQHGEAGTLVDQG